MHIKDIKVVKECVYTDNERHGRKWILRCHKRKPIEIHRRKLFNLLEVRDKFPPNVGLSHF